MLLKKENVEKGAIIAFWKIDETVDELLSILHHDKDLILQISQFGSEKRKLEYLATRVLLNTVLDDEKTIAYKLSGAPYLTDKSFNISIAHTGIYVTLILHPTRKVGIDIEKISDRAVRVQHKFLSQNEIDFVEKSSERTQLTLLWCAKEALYKIIDKEIIDFAEELRVSPFQPYLSGSIEAEEFCTTHQRRYTIYYNVEPEICCVWTVED
ncbi:MAG: 4'-phosphopantetheinyl transferase superfamily protein [Prevotellaceae bacterium]|jgi:phosphopantetheine--protein transferase-like protein|nr:4'-phosphopantetheinyl transferase superfamily protein [Prevotellaceae bacterium]